MIERMAPIRIRDDMSSKIPINNCKQKKPFVDENAVKIVPEPGTIKFIKNTYFAFFTGTDGIKIEPIEKLVA